MTLRKLQKVVAGTVLASMVATSVPSMDYGRVLASTNTSSQQIVFDGTVTSASDENVFKVTMDDTGYLTADNTGSEYDPNNEYVSTEDTPFSWDNVNMYFVMTDRFFNKDKSNDHAYDRSVGEVDADKYETRIGTFHGGDLQGLTEYINNGYFDALGTNAIWITAPYEQIHGALCSDKFKHYAYHGYYVLDYTNVDGNMGTEKDLETFIDTAHAHGIRVVFDIVLNHAGYADPVTAVEYGFGGVTDKFEQMYYKTSENQYDWSLDYDVENPNGILKASADWTTNWWGTSWIRALGKRLNGYEGQEGSGLDTCLNGLPDFKTETSNDPGIPPILKNKWTKEGNYDEKVAMTRASLQAGGLNASVTGYICAWLSQWVREYGVDGFRCDTAKHVAVSEWVKLKKSCVAALKDWRKNNPDKPGAQWTDDFWMTGEHWGHGVGKDDYFTSGAFDSMINFAYQGSEGKTGSGLEGTFAEYARNINSDPSFNVLSYISSHDTSLGARSANAGTAMLLNPGGVQTYYGDESGRQPGAGSSDQPTRSHMNWSSLNKEILSNWQKVGRFRRNHIAVGAGEHNKLAESPYTFSRTYKGKATVGAEKPTDFEDKVVVCLPGSAGTHEVTVGDVFADGTTLVDEYSGEEYTVSGGKVSATCDKNGVILLAEPSVTTPKAKVAASVTKGTVSSGVYNDDTITVKLAVQNMENASYTLNDKEAVSFTESVEVTFGEDTAYEEETTITVKGTSTIDQSEVTQSFKYARGKEPNVGGVGEGFHLRMKKSDFDGVPTIWIWSGEENYCTAPWPGDSLKEDGDYYVYENAAITGEASFIISCGTYRNTAEGETELKSSGAAEFDKAGNKVKAIEVSSGELCKVNVEYVDADGKVLKKIYRAGAEGEKYTVYAPKVLSTVAGYQLAAEQKESVKGTFAKEAETITFIYSTNGEAVATAKPKETKEPEETKKPDNTKEPEETKKPDNTKEPDKTAAPDKTATPDNTKEPDKTAAPDKTAKPDSTKAPAKTEAPKETPGATKKPNATEEPKATQKPSATQKPNTEQTGSQIEIDGLVVDKIAPQIVGTQIRIQLSGKGGSGQYEYKFIIENADTGIIESYREFKDQDYVVWVPVKDGNYVIHGYMRDRQGDGSIKKVTSNYTVTKKITLKSFKATKVTKKKIKFSWNVKGNEPMKYKLVATDSKGAKVTLMKYSKTKSKTYTFKKKGTYKISLYVKDSYGNAKTFKKTVKIK